MNQLKILKELTIIAVVMLTLDFTYFSFAGKMFAEQIASIQRVVMQVRPLGAFVCYFFLVLGLYYFIIREKRSIQDAAILGLVIYAVYESTNYALLKRWKPEIAIMDSLWGAVLFATTTYITYSVI